MDAICYNFNMGEIINFSDFDKIRFSGKKLNDINYNDPKTMEEYINFIETNMPNTDEELIKSIVERDTIGEHYKIFYKENWKRLTVAKRLDEIGGILTSLNLCNFTNVENVFMVSNFPPELDDTNGIVQNGVMLNIKLFVRDEVENIAPEVLYSAFYEYFYLSLDSLSQNIELNNLNENELDALNKYKYLPESLNAPRVCLNKQYDLANDNIILMLCDPKEKFARDNAMLLLLQAYGKIYEAYGIDEKFEAFIANQEMRKSVIEKRIEQIYGSYDNALDAFKENYIDNKFLFGNLHIVSKNTGLIEIDNKEVGYKFDLPKILDYKQIDGGYEIKFDNNTIIIKPIFEYSSLKDFERKLKIFKNNLTDMGININKVSSDINMENGIKITKLLTEKDNKKSTYYCFNMTKKNYGYIVCDNEEEISSYEEFVKNIISSWKYLDKQEEQDQKIDREFKNLFFFKKVMDNHNMEFSISNIYNIIFFDSSLNSFLNDKFYNFFKGCMLLFLDENTKIENFSKIKFKEFMENRFFKEDKKINELIKNYIKDKPNQIKLCMRDIINCDDKEILDFLNLLIKKI